MGSMLANLSLAQLSTTGTNFVAIVVTQYQQNISSKSIYPLFDAQPDLECNYYSFVTTKDAELRAAIQKTHSLGMKVMLKPHVDLLENHLPCGKFWRGEIGTSFSSQDWQEWLESYTSMILPYAKMAEEESVELFSVNCELYVANMNAPEELWRQLISKIRSVYSGKLTVASNWSPFPSTVKWWDAVDYIGVDA